MSYNKLLKLYISPNKLLNYGIRIKLDGKLRNAFQLLSFAKIQFSDLIKIWPSLNYIQNDVREYLKIQSHYSAYLERQNLDIESFKKDENLIFPNNFDFTKVGSLSNEVVEKLNKIKPPTLGAASRISGITPPAIIALLRHVKRKNKRLY